MIYNSYFFLLFISLRKGKPSECSSIVPNRGLVNHFQLSTPEGSSGRLKPAPSSCIDTSKKVIKLKTSSASSPPQKLKRKDPMVISTDPEVKPSGDTESKHDVKRSANEKKEVSCYCIIWFQYLSFIHHYRF